MSINYTLKRLEFPVFAQDATSLYGLCRFFDGKEVVFSYAHSSPKSEGGFVIRISHKALVESWILEKASIGGIAPTPEEANRISHDILLDHFNREIRPYNRKIRLEDKTEYATEEKSFLTLVNEPFIELIKPLNSSFETPFLDENQPIVLLCYLSFYSFRSVSYA